MEAEKAYNKFFYLSLPLNFQFILLEKKKFVLGVISGVDVDLLLDGSFSEELQENQIDFKYSFSKFPKLTTNLNGGLIAIIKLNENLGLSITPKFSRYIMPNIVSEMKNGNDIHIQIHQYYYYSELKVGLLLK